MVGALLLALCSVKVSGKIMMCAASLQAACYRFALASLLPSLLFYSQELFCGSCDSCSL